MASKGVTRVDVSEGDAFDPNTQEAMSTLPAQGPDAKPGTIAVKWQVSVPGRAGLQQRAQRACVRVCPHALTTD